MTKMTMLFVAMLVACVLGFVWYVRDLQTADPYISTTFTGWQTPQDGVTVSPGTNIVMEWECDVDDGSETIKNAYVKVVPIEWNKGRKGLEGSAEPIPVNDTRDGVEPGRTFWVKMPIVVPKELKDGLYEMDVRLCDKQGNVYNVHKKPLYALLQVKRK